MFYIPVSNFDIYIKFHNSWNLNNTSTIRSTNVGRIIKNNKALCSFWWVCHRHILTPRFIAYTTFSFPRYMWQFDAGSFVQNMSLLWSSFFCKKDNQQNSVEIFFFFSRNQNLPGDFYVYYDPYRERHKNRRDSFFSWFLFLFPSFFILSHIDNEKMRNKK